MHGRYKRLNCSTKYLYMYVFPLSILPFYLFSPTNSFLTASLARFRAPQWPFGYSLFCYHYAYGSSNDIGDIFLILLFLFAIAFSFLHAMSVYVCVSSTTKMVNVKRKRGSTD